MKRLLAGLLLLLCACTNGNQTSDFKLASNIPVDTAKYVKTIDGDTITVIYQGVTENVRMIGIDTPESKKNAKAKADAKKQKTTVDEIVAKGKKASAYTASVFHKNDVIYLEFDKEKRDKYKRLLAYVYTDNKMINSTLISEGYAVPMTIKPNTKYAVDFKKQYNQFKGVK